MLKPAFAQNPTTTSQAPPTPPTPAEVLLQCQSAYEQQFDLLMKWSNACDVAEKKVTMHENELNNLRHQEVHQHYLVQCELEKEKVLQVRMDAKHEEIARLCKQQKQTSLELELATQELESMQQGKHCQVEFVEHAKQQVLQAQKLLAESLQPAEPQEDDCGAENAQPHEISYACTEYLEDASDPGLCLMGHAPVDALVNA